MKLGISVIVCCYNSEKRLADTLAHLLNQKTNSFDWEIIIVDNASTDTTNILSQKILSKSLPPGNFKVIVEKKSGPDICS
jgi:glycosyltransferase involved in cell wall biosynthesis